MENLVYIRGFISDIIPSVGFIIEMFQGAAGENAGISNRHWQIFHAIFLRNFFMEFLENCATEHLIKTISSIDYFWKLGLFQK